MTVHETPKSAEAAPPAEPGSLVTAAEERHPIDRWVFGIAAALVIVLIIWGVASTETLSSVSSSVVVTKRSSDG